MVITRGRTFLTFVVCLALALVLGAQSAAARPAGSLPLGDSDLVETRTERTIAPGVRLTTIVRGTEPADPDEILTTPRGPWQVSLLTIDPRRATGELRAVTGPDLARVEKTSVLAAQYGALAAVNASFFTFSASVEYPGDPVGLGVYDGKLLSEPTLDPGEVGVLLDAGRLRAQYGAFSWAGHVQARGLRVGLEAINHPPVVPVGCEQLADQAACPADGDTVVITPEFRATTPTGPGTELVLDAKGCVRHRSDDQRGVALGKGELALQATGADVTALRRVSGCVEVASELRDEAGKKVRLGADSQAVNGRQRLLRDGVSVVPPVNNSFFARNPRTFIGSKRSGELVLGVIDGRRVTSVGSTLDETAAVAKSLGLWNSINLDGGGSSTMVVDGAVINTVAGSAERAVGDALLYLP
ncbi:phosphodiester glycosidase family protein [Microlunatus speluncae]|uniref:phosphodiester glycosidase family protein n=1 Tax=Microlunatus speluncae TaxID=2594267 RepID=UPI0012666C72|nr:phosphodiester glycosidase family protein [Microlunatus speluncae]